MRQWYNRICGSLKTVSVAAISVAGQSIMNMMEISNDLLLFIEDDHLAKGLCVSELVTMNDTGTPQQATSCLTTMVYKNSCFWRSSRATLALWVESINTREWYFRNNSVCQPERMQKRLHYLPIYPLILLRWWKYHLHGYSSSNISWDPPNSWNLVEPIV